MQRLKNRFSKEETKDLAYSYNKANEIDDNLVYGDEADESYDDEEHSSKSNSKHTSTDSKEDDDESVDDGDISRQEDEVERIKYQIAIKKKEKEVERMNKAKEKVAQQQRQSMSTATGGTIGGPGATTSEGGAGGSPLRSPTKIGSPEKTVTKGGVLSSGQKETAKVPIKPRGDPFKEIRERELIERIAASNKKDF